MSSTKHECILNSVTAVAFYQPLLGPRVVLAGEGAFLKLYESSTSKIIAFCRIFSEQIIHGIAVKNGGPSDSDFRVAIWGGTSFTILRTNEMNAIIQQKITNLEESEKHAPDWILAGAISPFSIDACCVFITAHRATLQVTYAEGCQGLYLRPLSAPSQSILYSADVVWISPSAIIVAAGTVFGEIQVFKWRMLNDEAPQSYHLFTFMGHDGSVFGVKISPEIMFADGRVARLLSSCSDDRTIRVWDLSLSPTENETLVTHDGTDPMVRGTGFGDSPEDSQDGLSATRCIAVVMAHASRIWRVDFLISPSSGPGFGPEIYVFSFGEDATCQRWVLNLRLNSKNMKNPEGQGFYDLSANTVLPYLATLKHVNTFDYHSGKHIWSAVLFHENATRTLLVTGGSDGKISIFNVSTASSSELICRGTYCELDYEFRDSRQLKQSPQNISANSNRVYSCPEDLGTAQVFKTKHKAGIPQSDAPNRYAFIANDELLISTSLGRLFLVLMGSQFRWQELYVSEIIRNQLKSYCLLVGIPTHRMAILASASGAMYTYSGQGNIAEIMKLNGKPAALINISRSREEEIWLLATKIGSNEAHLIYINPSVSQAPVQHQSMAIILAPNFVVTSATEAKGVVILGARNGSLAIYDLSSNADLVRVYPSQYAQSGDAITAIVPIASTDQHDNSCHFVTTCRNGSYSIFSLAIMKQMDLSIKAISLNLIHQCFPPLGPMIEAAWFEDSDLILYGFRSKNFVVWNESKEYEVAGIECGGAHRSYAYSPSPGKGGVGHFAYTKASKVYLNSQSQPSHIVLKPGGHGREIKACASNGVLIATGAEDTCIRIWNYGVEKENIAMRDLTCCAVIEKHTTGIQHLQWGHSIEGYHMLFSAGGSEEFHVWRISKISGFGIGVVCEATLQDKSVDGDLRIMGFEAETISESSLPSEMSVTREIRCRITFIYSDSTIKVYNYSKSQGFEKSGQTTYTTACLKQILCIRGSGNHMFFTTATDGHLSLWSHPFQGDSKVSNSHNDVTQHSLPTSRTEAQGLNPVSRLKLHQSSITAIDLHKLTPSPQNEKAFLLATTGDDNALKITLYQELRPVRRITVPLAHAAGITGVAFNKSMSENKCMPSVVQLLTIGVDQRIKKWKIRLNREVLHDSKVEDQARNRSRLIMSLSSQRKGDNMWTSVADPAGLVLWRHAGDGGLNGDHKSHALVFGNGIEIFGLGHEAYDLDRSATCKDWEADDLY